MKLKERIHRFLHDEKLKRKLYVIIFESDTPAGKLFDVILFGCILVSVLLVIIESLKGLPSFLTTPHRLTRKQQEDCGILLICRHPGDFHRHADVYD